LLQATSISAPPSPVPAAGKPASASATPTAAAAAAAAAAGGSSLLLSLFSQGRGKPPVPGAPPSANSSEAAAAATGGAQGPPSLSPAGSFTDAAAAAAGGVTGGTGAPGSASLTPASSMGSMAAAVTPAQQVPAARSGSPGGGSMPEPSGGLTQKVSPGWTCTVGHMYSQQPRDTLCLTSLVFANSQLCQLCSTSCMHWFAALMSQVRREPWLSLVGCAGWVQHDGAYLGRLGESCLNHSAPPW
jgi:hypothetical protein